MGLRAGAVECAAATAVVHREGGLWGVVPGIVV